ncbi:MAG: 2Fe-2S iron-sulfur cluster-binding protein, partial [Steroidobacteraceae bacterium]
MSSTYRTGLRLRDHVLRFAFDGRTIDAQAGDCVASALLAHGIRLVGRSVKYGRARGVFTAGPEEPNALLSVGAAPFNIPNVPATQLAVRAGLIVRSQNRWPTLRYDAASLRRWGGGVFGAGFYYKTFMWPSWRAWEGVIRRLAGLGEAPRASDLRVIDVEHMRCDVLVAGGGAAGLCAALAAARAGARVVLCEREVACGGELGYEPATIARRAAMTWVDDTLEELRARGARVLMETTLVGGSGGLLIAHRQRGGLPGNDVMFRVRSHAVVCATGAVERPIAFIDNDLPGVMLLGAAERYRALYGVCLGENLVLFGNHDRLYMAASRFLAAGQRVKAIVDIRAAAVDPNVKRLRADLQRDGVECLQGHAVVSAVGGHIVRGARVTSLADATVERTIPCDALLVSGGWSPAIQAGLHEGGSTAFVPELAAFVASAQPSCRAACGAADGKLEIGAVLADGHAAGARAARLAGATRDS